MTGVRAARSLREAARITQVPPPISTYHPKAIYRIPPPTFRWYVPKASHPLNLFNIPVAKCLSDNRLHFCVFLKHSEHCKWKTARLVGVAQCVLERLRLKGEVMRIPTGLL